MVGIILAGGSGSRLNPITNCVNKQLLPIYDKPMIYYSLSILMLSGIRKILIICNSKDILNFKILLGNGENLGCEFHYKVQTNPKGIADAFIIAKDFISYSKVALILGDNIFHGLDTDYLYKYTDIVGAHIFGYKVSNPDIYAVVNLDSKNNIISIEEKPINPNSNYIITGLYYYDNNVVDFVQNLSPSYRGELEITDINNIYLSNKKLNISILGEDIFWIDAGTIPSYNYANNFIKDTESNFNIKIGAIEEIAYRMGYISLEKLHDMANNSGVSYKNYLLSVF